MNKIFYWRGKKIFVEQKKREVKKYLYIFDSLIYFKDLDLRDGI